MMPTYKSIEISQAFHASGNAQSDNILFDDILDVRSPAEYADDHLPGAINVPVLNNEERARIGTLYSQVSPFEAKKQGAVLIARNIARHVEESFGDRQKSWRPLIYCWRGGMRSGAMAHILAQIGWKSNQLEGGYKAYRRSVITALETLPIKFNFCVINGSTGSGKSHLLEALAAQGAQVLDLEKLAQHRGSLLGKLPDQPQPTQKTFETRLWDALHAFTPERPIYIEAESRKVGALSVPTALHERMRESACVRVEVPQEARVALLMHDYAHFLQNPALLAERLSLLVELHGRVVIDRWCEMAIQSEWEPLVEALLTQHYDPAYKRSSGASFPQLNNAQVLRFHALDAETLRKAAENLIGNER
jgi:tRNA 2-selenouridine synthase